MTISFCIAQYDDEGSFCFSSIDSKSSIRRYVFQIYNFHQNNLVVLLLLTELVQYKSHRFSYYLFHSGWVQDGCFVRKGMTSYGKGIKLNGYYGYSGFTVNKCASECSKRSDCQTFELDSFNKCFLKRGGKILRKLLTASAGNGGLCPKGKFSFREWVKKNRFA